MDKLIFRFRRNEEHCIDNLLNFRIEGAKYITMQDKSEASLYVDIARIKCITRLDESIISATGDIIRDHILNSFYMACFASIDQTDDMDMWETYAGSDGFCLVYRDSDIGRSVRRSLENGGGRCIIFRDVTRGKQATDITGFVLSYLKQVGNDIDNEEAYKKAATCVGDDLSADERSRIIGSMFHKIGEFPEKYEKRIVVLGKNSDSNYCDDMVPEKTAPIKIICSSKMSEETKTKLREFAEKNAIEFAIQTVE